MLAPIMQSIDVCFHYFFVPNRLIMDNWEKFITNGENGRFAPLEGNGVYPVTSHQFSSFGDVIKPGQLADYFNFPTFTNPESTPGNYYKVDWMPFRAYNLIYNEYYRDQNLEAPLPVPKGDVNNAFQYEDADGIMKTATFRDLMTLRYRSYKKDYFTSALPWTQRGPQVLIPMGTKGNLKYTGDGQTLVDVNGHGGKTGNISSNGETLELADNANPVNINVSETHVVETENIDGTINDLRTAFKVQEWLERNARGGARYIEQLFSHFGVRSSDARLQRPEYLGGTKAPVVISDITQTSQTSDNSELGEQAGQATSLSNSYVFNRRFEEHGWIIGLMSIMPRASYYQGYPRKFNRRSFLDFYFPEFSHLGEQAIKNEELYYNPTLTGANKDGAENVGIFGYTPRYAEYRFNNDEIHGEFRSSLNFWHMGRQFANLPKLNKEFISTNDDSIYRPFSVTNQTEEHCYCQIYQDIQATRLIPRYGTPEL